MPDQIKVYELAKRLGVSSVLLMDKIRKDWKLPVRTHMESLTPELAREIEQKYLRQSGAPKKKPAKKKKAAGQEAAQKAPPAKKAPKKPVKKAAKKTDKAGGKASKDKAKKKPAAAAAKPPEKSTAEKPRKKALAKPKRKPPAKPKARPAPKKAARGKAPDKARDKAPDKARGKAPSRPQIKSPAASKKSLPAKPPQASAAEARPEAPRPPAAGRIIRRRKSEQKPLAPAPVRPDPASQEELAGAAAGAFPSPEARGLPKSIRSDMVSVQNTDPLQENFWSAKEAKDEAAKKQPRKPMVEKEVSSRFLATDFRKREVIFQPKKKRVATGEFKATQITTPKAHKRILKVHGEMEIETICRQIGVKRRELVRKLRQEGVETARLQALDFETIALIVPDFGFEAKNTKKTEQEVLASATGSGGAKDEGGPFEPKPPVVTVMGHVDHGKTTLLDAIRKTKVAEREAGGITQHIGAYTVPFKNSWITFIDTPGHEAFTAMRGRGAKVTDIVVIVVSAADGVMPQTIEAVNHAKAAKAPLIVAMTKMDAAGANPDKIKQQMSEHGLNPEDWGGDVSFIPLAAPKGEGISELLEQLQLIAGAHDLKCRPGALAKGFVLEARREKGRGCVVSLLARDGTLKSGQNIVAGVCSGRIRQMKNDQGQIIKEAGPGFAVEIAGLSELPQAGDMFHALEGEKAAKEIISFRQGSARESEQQAEKPDSRLSLEEALLKAHLEKQKKRDLNLILKTDAQGSMEALRTGLEKLKTDEISLKIAHSATGGITESDVLLASTVEGVIAGFNVRPDGKAAAAAKEQSIEIACFSVIYELLDYVKKRMLGLLDPEILEEELGAAEAREIFRLSKGGVVAGCYVTRGKMARNSFVRLIREGRLVYEGAVSSLKRFKEDAKEVAAGLECGIMIENFSDIKPKDILESYIKKEVSRTEL